MDLHSPITTYAELALKEKEDGGINVLFDNDKYETPEVCRKALVRFRNSFTALKAKDRREANRFAKAPRYDGLGCFVEQRPNGWVISIRSNVQLPSGVTKANGEPIQELASDYKRWRELQIKASLSDNKACDFSQEDIDFFWEFDPKKAEIVFNFKGWELPTKGTEDD